MILRYKKHHPDARIDYPAKKGDIGYDVYAVEDVTIEPLSDREVPIGLSFELPEGYYFTIETRSGHGVRKHLRVHRGIVDNGYRGIMTVQVYNHHSTEKYTVVRGEKIAQISIHKIHTLPLVESEELSSSERGDSGFGSTGR